MVYRLPTARVGLIGGLFGSVPLIAIFLLAVWCARSFHPEAAGFDKAGFALLAYHASRAVLMLFVVALALTIGHGAIRLLGHNPIELFGGERRAFVISTFVGITIYGVAYAVVGLLGLLGLPVALIGTVPVLLFAPASLAPLTSAGYSVLARAFTERAPAQRVFFAAVLIATVGSFAFFLTMHVVAVIAPDPNIWEHYLHYYREVLRLGSTQPNEVWHHFFATKPAGFFLLINELSDFFGPPIVNGAFAIAAGVVIIDLIEDHCGDLVWGLFGAALFFLFMAGDWISGTMFKHHVIILAYSAFALWSVTQLQRETAPAARNVIIGAMLCAFLYMGFYASLIGVIFPLVFLFVGLGNIALGARWNFYPLFGFAVAAAGGTVLSFLFNYWLTGVPDITPMKMFWSLADQAKAVHTLGLGGIEYFLRTDNDVGSQSVRWTVLLWHFVRFPLSNKALVVTALAAAVVAFIDRRDRSDRSTLALLLRLIAFALPLSILAVAFQSNAVVHRAGLFTIVLTTIGAVVVWQRIIRHVAMAAHLPAFGSQDERKIYDVLAAALIVVTLAGAGGTALSLIGSGRLGYARLFSSGSISLKTAMTQLEPSINRSTVGLESAITVGDMGQYRRRVATGSRIMRLTYDAGYSYALPGDGIVSEPTYALIDDPQRLLAADAEEVALYLRRRHIDHFIINLKGPLYSTVAFTKLFDPAHLDRFFELSYRHGDLFILTWRRPNGAPIPKSLIVGLDFKRAGVLNAPFAHGFAHQMTNDETTIATIGVFDRTKAEFMTALDRQGDKLRAALSSKEARENFQYMWRQAAELAGAEHFISLSSMRCWTRACREGQEPPEIADTFSASKLKRMMLDRFLSGLRAQYVDVFGPKLASSFEASDEREPFGPMN